MQQTWTIEIRMDFKDPGKYEAVRPAFLQLAQHVYATVTLLADGVKPQIVIYSDDFMYGHQEIAMLDASLTEGLPAVTSSVQPAAAPPGITAAVTEPPPEDDGSAALLAAMEKHT